MSERLGKNREREIPSNLVVVWHKGSVAFLQLTTRCLDPEGLPCSRHRVVDEVRNPDGQMEQEFTRLFKKGLHLANTRPLMKVQLTRYDPMDAPDSDNNAPARPENGFRKAIEIRVKNRVYRNRQ